MTLMDDPYAGSTPHEELLSTFARTDNPRVSVVIPMGKTSDVTSTVGRLFGLDGEVILVGGRPTAGDVAAARALHPGVRLTPETCSGADGALRAGFAAARGDCIVVLDGDGETSARDVERFAAALTAGCGSIQRTAA
jgi:glycosyltransferase involved in cell wall biosynthesis